MKNFILATAFGLFPFAVIAAPIPDIPSTLNQWVAAVESGSVDKIVGLYDRHAVMISTFYNTPMTTRAQLVDYYKKAVANPDIEIDINESHPRQYGNVAINSGLYTFHYTQDGEPVTIPARFSFTYLLEGGKWVIVDHHSSRLPEINAPVHSEDE